MFYHCWSWQYSKRKPGQVNFHQDIWDCYWQQGEQIGQKLTCASPVTIPQVFAKTNSAGPSFLVCKVANIDACHSGN